MVLAKPVPQFGGTPESIGQGKGLFRVRGQAFAPDPQAPVPFDLHGLDAGTDGLAELPACFPPQAAIEVEFCSSLKGKLAIDVLGGPYGSGLVATFHGVCANCFS